MNRFRVVFLLGLFCAVLALRTGPHAAQAFREAAQAKVSVYCDAGRPAAGEPLLAIVIDDLTTGAAGFEELLRLNVPLTFALLPEQPDVGALARRVAALGHEVILHLPMDAGGVNPEWYGGRPISARLSDQEIREMVSAWLEAVPEARGMNNHMGTVATQDERVVRAVLEVARQQGKFILDSQTHEGTVIPRVAVEMGVPCMQRSLFLDHEPGKEAAMEQLRRLADWAVRYGAAIGIGHVGAGREGTPAAIREMLPYLRERGIRLVTLSTLLELQRPGQE